MVRYSLEQRIGVGGVAEVFRARREEAGQSTICAVKRLLPSFRRDAQLRLRLEDEARIGARLRHSNIITVIESFELEGDVCLALEYVDGISVERLIARGLKGHFVPIRVTSAIAVAVFAALQYAHTLGVLHRDVSASNVLVSADGSIKLTDFGIADSEGRLSATAPGHVIGKEDYMSPQRRQGARATAADDFFSLGIMLERLLAAADPRERAQSLATPIRAFYAALKEPSGVHQAPDFAAEVARAESAGAAEIAAFLSAAPTKSQVRQRAIPQHQSLDGTTVDGSAPATDSRRQGGRSTHRRSQRE